MPSKHTLPVLLSMMGLFCTSLASADVPAQVADKAEREDETLRDEQDNLNRHCSTHIQSTIDWESFAKPIMSGDQRSPAGFCKEVFAAIRGLCTTDESKRILDDGIKRFTCEYAGKGKQAISLSNGHLVLALDWDRSNLIDYVKDYLRTARALVTDGFTLRMKHKMHAENTHFDDDLAHANKRCGLELTAQIDWKSFNKDLEQSDESFRRNPHGLCSQVFVAIESLCDRQAYKKAMSRKLSSVSCRFAGKNKDGVKLQGRNLVLGIDWDASNHSERIRKYLEKVL